MPRIRVLTTAQVLDGRWLPLSTLNNWINDGLVAPYGETAPGHRFDRYWRPIDATAVRVVKQLRDVGCPVEVVRQLRILLRSRKVGDDRALLFWNGGDELVWADHTVLSRIPAPDRRATIAVFISVATWLAQAMEQAELRDLVAIANERANYRAQHPRRIPVKVVLLAG